MYCQVFCETKTLIYVKNALFTVQVEKQNGIFHLKTKKDGKLRPAKISISEGNMIPD